MILFYHHWWCCTAFDSLISVTNLRSVLIYGDATAVYRALSTSNKTYLLTNQALLWWLMGSVSMKRDEKFVPSIKTRVSRHFNGVIFCICYYLRNPTANRYVSNKLVRVLVSLRTCKRRRDFGILLLIHQMLVSRKTMFQPSIPLSFMDIRFWFYFIGTYTYYFGKVWVSALSAQVLPNSTMLQC